MFGALRGTRTRHATAVHRSPSGRGRRAAEGHVTSPARCPCAGSCPRCTSRPSTQTLGSGAPLEAGVRRTLEASYHADLSSVRVHTGPAASEANARIGANAFTIGSHLVFGRDQYTPYTRRGFDRVAHEVAHALQQRNGSDSGDAGVRGRAEGEASAAADAAFAGRPATIASRTAGLLQRQQPEETPRFFTSQPEFHLQLDPEIEAMMLQHYMRWWIGSSITEGTPDVEGEQTSGTTEGEGETSPGVPLPHELPPSFFQPYDPAELVVEPDVGALLSPYNIRNVPLGSRDVDAAQAIFAQNYRFVSVLPDLRDAAPDFLRPLIPTTWRRSLAEAFTAATLNAQLKHDYPTPLEAADLSFYRMTGVSTTYIAIPGFSF